MDKKKKLLTPGMYHTIKIVAEICYVICIFCLAVVSLALARGWIDNDKMQQAKTMFWVMLALTIFAFLMGLWAVWNEADNKPAWEKEKEETIER